MTSNPLEEFLTVIEQITGHRPDAREAMALLLESAVGREGWFTPHSELVPNVVVAAA